MKGPSIDKIVVVTRKTPLGELVDRFGTLEQARFYLAQMGLPFDDYEEADATYRRAESRLRDALPRKIRSQWIDRSFLPTFLFGKNDLIVTLGQDGLVVNTAKYIRDQVVLAFNPDPNRFDGILLPFQLENAESAFDLATAGALKVRSVSMARVRLNDGQELHAVNDLFIGHKSHGSARYRLAFGDTEEEQSSSGVIVSTGAGSTGWYTSIIHGANGVVRHYLQGKLKEKLNKLPDRLDWESDELIFSVREPFVSRTSSASLIHDRIRLGEKLTITSRMPQSGVIFSDGVEEDYLPFNSGSIAEISLAERKLHLLVHTE